jgi:hypothetical protein
MSESTRFLSFTRHSLILERWYYTCKTIAKKSVTSTNSAYMLQKKTLIKMDFPTTLITKPIYESSKVFKQTFVYTTYKIA